MNRLSGPDTMSGGMTCIVGAVGVNGIATAETAAYRQRQHFRRR